MSGRLQYITNRGSNLVADVFSSNPSPGVNIIVFRVNNPPTRNQQWTLVSSNPGPHHDFIQSAVVGNGGGPGWAFVATGRPGQALTINPGAIHWEIIPLPNNGNSVLIRHVSSRLVWTVPEGATPGTPITIEPVGAAGPTLGQQWFFRNVD